MRKVVVTENLTLDGVMQLVDTKRTATGVVIATYRA